MKNQQEHIKGNFNVYNMGNSIVYILSCIKIRNYSGFWLQFIWQYTCVRKKFSLGIFFIGNEGNHIRIHVPMKIFDINK